jgi:membrane-bound inhibitor of C-type lysozyme
MKKIAANPFVLFVAIALMMGGCASQKYGHAPVTPRTLSCSGNVPAQVTLYSPSEAKLSFEDKSYQLNRIETASGVQYGNSDITFWNKGIDAMITRKDGSITTCTFMPKTGL